jgi:hypothetical protein
VRPVWTLMCPLKCLPRVNHSVALVIIGVAWDWQGEAVADTWLICRGGYWRGCGCCGGMLLCSFCNSIVLVFIFTNDLSYVALDSGQCTVDVKVVGGIYWR